MTAAIGDDARTQVYRYAKTKRQVAELRDLCRHWSYGPERFWDFDDMLAVLARPGGLCLYAAAGEDLLWQAAVFADVGPYTTDLLYVYVRPEHRRRGLGATLVAELVAALGERGGQEALFLEVRESNQAAQRLYERLGFAPLNRRQRYYADGEDALVYRLALDAEGSTP